MKKAGSVLLVLCMLVALFALPAAAKGSTFVDDFWGESTQKEGAAVSKDDSGYSLTSLEGAGFFVATKQQYTLNGIKIQFKMEVTDEATGRDKWVNIGFAKTSEDAGIVPGILIRMTKSGTGKACVSCFPENNNTLINAIYKFDFSAVHTLEFQLGVNDEGTSKYFMYLDGKKLVAGNKSSGVEDYVTEAIAQAGIKDKACVAIGGESGGLKISNVKITDGKADAPVPTTVPASTTTARPNAGDEPDSSATTAGSGETTADSTTSTGGNSLSTTGTTAADNNGDPTKAADGKTDKGGFAWWIVIVAAVVVLGGGAALYFFVLKKKKAE